MRKSIEFDLPCGHSIQLIALDQCYTEEGRLEGLPTRESNRKRLEWLAVEFPKRSPHIAHLLIPPYRNAHSVG